MIQTIQKRITAIPLFVSATFMIIALVILLWIPFGVNTTVGAFEEWTVLNDLQLGRQAIFSPVNPTRPLVFSFFAVLSLLPFDDLFLTYNLASMGLFIGKALVVYAVLRRVIPKIPHIALMTALLFIIYPADVGLFSFRSINIDFSIFLGLLAIYLLIRYWQQANGWLWPVLWGVQLLTLLTYEVMYLLLLASPLLLLWLDRTFSTRFWKTTILWLMIPTVLLTWTIFNITQTGEVGGYLRGRIEEAQSSGAFRIESMLRRIPPLYYRHIIEWRIPLKHLNSQSPYLPVAGLAGLLVVVVSGHHFTKANLTRKTYFALLAVGLIVIVMGYSVYLPSTFESEHWRTHLASSLGAALFVAVLLYGVTRWLPVFTMMMSGVLITLAAIYALNQHAFYVDSSIYIQRLLAGIIVQAPQIDPDATILVIDEADLYQIAWRTTGFDIVLSGALSYLYGSNVKANFCNLYPSPDTRIDISCNLAGTHVDRVYFGMPTTIPYNEMIAFRTKAGGEIELLDEIPLELMREPGAQDYNPYLLMNQDAPLPERAATFFTCWPLESCFPVNSPPQAHIRIEFDRVIRGMGWEAADPDRHRLWTMRGTRSTILINPVTDRPLEIQFRITRPIDLDVTDSLKFEVNGHFVELEEIDAANQILRAVIPATFLQPVTELAFHVSQTEGALSYGLEFDWLEANSL